MPAWLKIPPERLISLFPLLLIMTLVGVSAWLMSVVNDAMSPEQTVRKGPDLILRQFTSVTTLPSGAMRDRLTAAEMQYTEGREEGVLSQPSLFRQPPDSAPLKVVADTARIDQQRDEAWFEGNVRLERSSGSAKPVLTATTDRLWVNSRTGQARTESAIEMQQGAKSASAVGFEYDHDRQSLVLKNQVRVKYVK